MNWRKVTIYFFGPLALVLPMVLMYFSGIEILQLIISPRIEGLYPNSNRELGLLESTQNVVLLFIIGLIIRAWFIHKPRWLMIPVFIAFCGATFVFLEEIDYGLHYKEYFTGVTAEDAAEVRNWHNVGDRTSRSKQALDAAVIVWFLVVPLLFAGSSYKWVRTLVPDKYAVLTLIAMFIVRSLAHGLQDAGFEGSGTMDKNLSEFRELVTYYLGAVYLFDVSERRMRGRPHLGDRTNQPGADTESAATAA